LVEYVPKPRPTREKFQRKARLRRIKQQYRDGQISTNDFEMASRRIEEDYAART
jgi:hypothetical protein